MVACCHAVGYVDGQRGNLAVGTCERLVVLRAAEEADDTAFLFADSQRVLVSLGQAGCVQ